MVNKSNKEYEKYADKKVPKPTYIRNIIFAFLIGGFICTVGQFISNWLKSKGLDDKSVGSATAIILVFAGTFLTGLGVYDKISKVGGAGATIPITGFSNAMASPAMEFKKEGFIFGVAAKMFIIAGPVIVYGVGSSIVVGIIYVLFTGGGN